MPGACRAGREGGHVCPPAYSGMGVATLSPGLTPGAQETRQRLPMKTERALGGRQNAAGSTFSYLIRYLLNLSGKKLETMYKT